MSKVNFFDKAVSRCSLNRFLREIFPTISVTIVQLFSITSLLLSVTILFYKIVPLFYRLSFHCSFVCYSMYIYVGDGETPEPSR